MAVKVEIDKNSGFCPGVVTAIRKAEEELEKSGKLYCLGDIVHNSNEVERLKSKGLITITHDELRQLHGVKVLLRAHGEPPETYRIAKENSIEIIDATCPVVLQLQRRIRRSYEAPTRPQIVIYGKPGHAEVNGLVGQTDGTAIVVEDEAGVDRIDFSRDVSLYSQTTKSREGLQRIEEEIRRILLELGEDPEREGLLKTPERVRKSLQFLTRGYKQDINEVINGAIFNEDCDDMVIVRNIEFYSMCEHHMLPFFGKCHIGYVPKGKVFGVSKLARLVDVFARRLQIQERMTRQIAMQIMESVAPDGVGVVVEAQHLCMLMRGVEKQNSVMKTSCMLGSFRRSEATRLEFLNLIRER